MNPFDYLYTNINKVYAKIPAKFFFAKFFFTIIPYITPHYI